VDFDRDSLAINQLWPGFVAGEWHNNHHLFPNSARAGFLRWQPDISFAFIRLYRLLKEPLESVVEDGGPSGW
jgi:fatty-acid desaturase